LSGIIPSVVLVYVIFILPGEIISQFPQELIPPNIVVLELNEPSDENFHAPIKLDISGYTQS
jgi:hypothetical protein